MSDFGTCDGSIVSCGGTESTSLLSSAPCSTASSLFLCGLLGTAFLGGVFGSFFSCVLLAELCVGRIILAKNPPSAGFDPAMLVRAGFFGGIADGAGKDARGAFGRGCNATAGVRFLVSAEGLLVVVMEVRLGERAGAPAPSFAAEAVVGAVREAGRRTGRVGDFGWVFVDGDVGPAFLSILVFLETGARGDVADINTCALDAAEGRLDF